MLRMMLGISISTLHTNLKLPSKLFNININIPVIAILHNKEMQKNVQDRLKN